jgi:oxygen-dependent protoporphyrinogen oxidase
MIQDDLSIYRAHMIQVEDLGLVDDLLYTKKDSPAAKNRYIYYPDRLNRLPAEPSDLGLLGTIELLRSGILAGMQNIFWEPFQPGRPKGRQDESISNFIRRRLDGRVADNLVSAVFHGIYAGDISQLSAKTLLSTAWALEGKFGSVGGGLYNANTESTQKGFWSLMHPYDLEEYENMLSDIELDKDLQIRLSPAVTSTFTFRNGLQQLVKSLEESLRQNEQIDIVTDTRIMAENLSAGPKIAVGVSSQALELAQHCSLYASHHLIRPATSISSSALCQTKTSPTASQSWSSIFSTRNRLRSFSLAYRVLAT